MHAKTLGLGNRKAKLFKKKKKRPKLENKAAKSLDKKSIFEQTSLSIDDEHFVDNLIELYEREKESRCYFQLERDKLAQMLEIERDKYERLKSDVHDANSRLFEFEQWHLKETEYLNKKIKCLIYGNNLRVNSLKLESVESSSLNARVDLKESEAYLDSIRSRLDEFVSRALNADEILKNICDENERRLAQLKTEYADNLQRVRETCEQNFDKERETFSLMNRNFAHEINELKSEQVHSMKKLMNDSLNEMKTYFKHLVKELLDKIGALNKENKHYEMRCKLAEKRALECEKNIGDISLENKSLASKLNNASTLANLYLSNKRLFRVRENDLKKLGSKRFRLDLENETLLQINQNLRCENERLRKHAHFLIRKFNEKIEEINCINLKKRTTTFTTNLY